MRSYTALLMVMVALGACTKERYEMCRMYGTCEESGVQACALYGTCGNDAVASEPAASEFRSCSLYGTCED